MSSILDEYKRYTDDSLLTEEEKAKVRELVNDYEALNMDLFIRKIGGMERIEEMKRINDVADGMYVVGGKVVHKLRPNSNASISNRQEDLDEWKKGFMEGFEEAYKRLNMR